MLGSAFDIISAGAPPRAAFLDYPLGHSAGKPQDPADQDAVLRAALTAFEKLSVPGDLVTLSTSPSSGAPTLPSSPAWEWSAAAFAGTQAVTIDGVLHAITGSPQVWMP